MDVNARRTDIEAAENPDVDMDEIFSMESEDVKICMLIILTLHIIIFTRYIVWFFIFLVEEDEMHLPVAETIDICMDKIFLFVELEYTPPLIIGQLLPAIVPAEKPKLTVDQLYKMLLKAFEIYVLPTYKTVHVQFIMFYFCSFKVSSAIYLFN